MEAVYRDSASLVLDHTNGVYIMKPEQANDPMAARVPAGKTLLVVYCDDAMIRSDIDARQEMLKIRLNEQGEHVALFSIKPARFDMKAFARRRRAPRNRPPRLHAPRIRSSAPRLRRVCASRPRALRTSASGNRS